MSSPSPEQVKTMLKYFPSRPDHDMWLIIISAVGNTFDEETALNILLSHFSDEKRDETLYKLRHRLSKITIGSLIHIAKKYGYTQNTLMKTNSINDKITSKVPYPRYSPEEERDVIYSFKDEHLEERAAIMEYEGGMERFRADRIILEQNPCTEAERVFRLAVNKKVVNKNLNPETMLPYKNYSILTSGFRNEILTINQIAEEILEGHALCCSILKADAHGHTRRNGNSFLGAEIFAIDVDEGLNLEECLKKPETKHACLIYTTPSHTNLHHRYRLIFPLPRLIVRPEHYRATVEHFVRVFGADKQCTDPVRAFYGNTEAKLTII